MNAPRYVTVKLTQREVDAIAGAAVLVELELDDPNGGGNPRDHAALQRVIDKALTAGWVPSYRRAKQ